jgi:hypothetical protein
MRGQRVQELSPTQHQLSSCLEVSVSVLPLDLSFLRRHRQFEPMGEALGTLSLPLEFVTCPPMTHKEEYSNSWPKGLKTCRQLHYSFWPEEPKYMAQSPLEPPSIAVDLQGKSKQISFLSYCCFLDFQS